MKNRIKEQLIVLMIVVGLIVDYRFFEIGFEISSEKSILLTVFVVITILGALFQRYLRWGDGNGHTESFMGWAVVNILVSGFVLWLMSWFGLIPPL